MVGGCSYGLATVASNALSVGTLSPAERPIAAPQSGRCRTCHVHKTLDTSEEQQMGRHARSGGSSTPNGRAMGGDGRDRPPGDTGPRPPRSCPSGRPRRKASTTSQGVEPPRGGRVQGPSERVGPKTGAIQVLDPILRLAAGRGPKRRRRREARSEW
jgi:hypothetical protein